MRKDGSERLAGVVLAGGSSARLGRDKAALVLDGGQGQGVDMLTRTALLLQKLVPEVFVVGRAHERLPFFPDDCPRSGPLGGIATALLHTGRPCLVLPCDLPFMDRQTLVLLVEARERRPAHTLCTGFVHSATGRREPLAAVYEPKALPFLADCLKEKRLQAARAIPEAFFYGVPYETERALAFFCINTPADYEAARRLSAMPGEQNAR